MKDTNLYEKTYLRKLDEDISVLNEDADGINPSLAEPEAAGLPPDGLGDVDVPGEQLPNEDSLSADDGGRAFNDLKSYMDTLPQDGQISNQQIIDLAKKYAEYFKEVKDTIRELQNKQLANEFEDCLNVKFLPLSKALSNMIDELEAGVSDKVQTKNEKAAKENGASLEV